MYGYGFATTVQNYITIGRILFSMGTEQLQNRIVLLKSRELELMKETQAVHDELMLSIGRKQGYDEAKTEYELRIQRITEILKEPEKAT